MHSLEENPYQPPTIASDDPPPQRWQARHWPRAVSMLVGSVLGWFLSPSFFGTNLELAAVGTWVGCILGFCVCWWVQSVRENLA
jgi:hypothetical protein